MLCMQLRASSSTFSACISTYSVGPEQLMWCLYGVGCSGTSRSLRVRKVQETLRSALQRQLGHRRNFLVRLQNLVFRRSRA